MTHRSVTFLSDYGLDDEFVAVCKGLILQVCPGADILDVTHNVSPGDIRAGALALARAIQYLPAGVHLGVVDPTVGTDRKPVAIQAVDGRLFVGPDNGLLSPAVAICGGTAAAVVLEPSRWGVEEPSPTFQGRDVFAPAAGALAGGAALADLGGEVSPAELVPMLLPLSQESGGRLEGAVLWIDHYGNVQTNVTEEDLDAIGTARGETLLVTFGRIDERVPLVGTFADVERGRLLAFVDSTGQLAVGANGENAAGILRVSEGAHVTVEKAPDPPGDGL